MRIQDSIIDQFLDSIKIQLSNNSTDVSDSSQTHLSEAAVLIPIFYKKPDWHLLFIRRTESVQHHKGQVAFPGGMREAEDASLIDTALRETYEEIGLAPADVRILGQLEPVVSITNFSITPVVGYFTWPYTYNPSPFEVSRIFSIPLRWLSEKSNHEARIFETPEGVFRNVIYFDEYDNELLWGITARITLNLIDIIS